MIIAMWVSIAMLKSSFSLFIVISVVQLSKIEQPFQYNVAI